uniref:Uncharacterized protein n=1 Tax=Arundo donax TaxID=35708 RepID=A0A0A9FYK8_ARUDO
MQQLGAIYFDQHCPHT